MACATLVLLSAPTSGDEVVATPEAPAFDARPERTIEVSDRASLLRAIASAKPGTAILLAPGIYEGGIYAEGLAGELERPIILASLDASKPARIRGGGSAFHLVDPQNVVLRDLVLENASANGLNIDDGGSFETPARGVTLRNVVVRNEGVRGNRDGIKLSGLTRFRIDGCTVERWGDGGSGIDMVGCSVGLIVDSVFRHLDPEGANGVQAKGGSRDITIRRSRFERAGGRGVNLGGSTGLPYFRPRAAGYEAKDIVVEDSIFVGSGAPVAFVGVDGAIVRHNLMWRPRRWVIRILQETQAEGFVPSRRGRFEKNIICFRSDELRSIVNVGPHTAPETFTFTENAWFAIDAPERTRALVRGLPVEERGARYGIDPKLADPESGDFERTANDELGDAGPRRATSEAEDRGGVHAGERRDADQPSEPRDVKR